MILTYDFIEALSVPGVFFFILKSRPFLQLYLLYHPFIGQTVKSYTDKRNPQFGRSAAKGKNVRSELRKFFFFYWIYQSRRGELTSKSLLLDNSVVCRTTNRLCEDNFILRQVPVTENCASPLTIFTVLVSSNREQMYRYKRLFALYTFVFLYLTTVR